MCVCTPVDPVVGPPTTIRARDWTQGSRVSPGLPTSSLLLPTDPQPGFGHMLTFGPEAYSHLLLFAPARRLWLYLVCCSALPSGAEL